MVADRAQILISWMQLALAIAVLPDFGILTWWNHRLGSSGIHLVVALNLLQRFVLENLPPKDGGDR